MALQVAVRPDRDRVRAGAPLLRAARIYATWPETASRNFVGDVIDLAAARRHLRTVAPKLIVSTRGASPLTELEVRSREGDHEDFSFMYRLSGRQITQLVGKISEMQTAEDRANALAALLPHLSREKMALAAAVSIASLIEDDWWRAFALSAIAACGLGDDLSARALEVAVAIDDPFSRSICLACFLNRGPISARERMGDLIVTKLGDIQDPLERAFALSFVEAVYPDPPAAHALRLRREIGDAVHALADVGEQRAYPRALILSMLAQYLSQEKRDALIEVVTHYDLTSEGHVPAFLLLSYLSPSQTRNLVVSAVKKERDALLLGYLAAFLPTNGQSNVLDAISVLKTDILRAALLTALSLKISPTLVDRALEVANTLSSQHYRATALKLLKSRSLEPPPRWTSLTGEKFELEYSPIRDGISINFGWLTDQYGHESNARVDVNLDILIKSLGARSRAEDTIKAEQNRPEISDLREPLLRTRNERIAHFSGRQTWAEAVKADPTLKPLAHIARTYPDRRRGLLRPDLWKIDAPLAQALKNWLNYKRTDGSKPNGIPADFGLMTADEWYQLIDREEGALTGAQVMEAVGRGDPNAGELSRRFNAAKRRGKSSPHRPQTRRSWKSGNNPK